MRPDATCEIGTTNRGEFTFGGPPCKYYTHTDTGPPSARHQCDMYNIIFDKIKVGGKPQDLIDDGTYTRNDMFRFFFYCWFLKIEQTGGTYDPTCNRCGECCKAWAVRKYALDPTKPCKPADWKGRGNPANPCTKLVGTEAPYSCELYGTGDFPSQCVNYPMGTELDVFEQFLNTTGLAMPIITGIESTPSCSFSFVRES